MLITDLRWPRLQVHWTGPVLVTALGIAGLLVGRPHASAAVAVDVQAFFGAVLVSYFGWCFQARMRRLIRPAPSDIWNVSRELSRRIYIMIWALALFEKLQCLVEVQGDTSRGAVLRAYFAFALLALITTRILAIWYSRRAERRRCGTAR
jgi:hypothetical protein